MRLHSAQGFTAFDDLRGDAMKFSKTLAILTGMALLGSGNSLLAQDAHDDAAVLVVIEQQWEANEKGDGKWIDSLLADDFTGWTNGTPAPRTKESTRKWEKFESKQWDGMEHELYVLSLVVHGDTAVAHYLYSNAGKNAKGETEVNHGRFTDMLVRIDGDWKFLAWHGGADNHD